MKSWNQLPISVYCQCKRKPIRYATITVKSRKMFPRAPSIIPADAGIRKCTRGLCCRFDIYTSDSHSQVTSSRNRRLKTIYNGERGSPYTEYCSLMTQHFRPPGSLVGKHPYVRRTWQLHPQRDHHRNLKTIYKFFFSCTNHSIVHISIKNVYYTVCIYIYIYIPCIRYQPVLV